MQTQFRSSVETKPYSKEAIKKVRYPTTVFLRKDPARPRMFFCMNCQGPMFKYQGGQVAMVVPGNADDNPDQERVLVFPIIIFCKNGSCDMTYVFEGWAR